MSSAKAYLESIANEVATKPTTMNMDIKDTTIVTTMSKEYSGKGYAYLFDKKLATKVIKDVASSWVLTDIGGNLSPHEVNVDIKTNHGVMSAAPVIIVELKFNRNVLNNVTNGPGGWFDGF